MNDVAELVAAAGAGETRAWDELVDRFAALIWSVARSQGLDAVDAAEVSQTTWLRLAEHIRGLSEPARVGAWLTTTARREAIRVGRLGSRHVLVDPWLLLQQNDETAKDPDTSLLRSEEDLEVQEAVATLSGRCRDLLARIVASDEPPSYAAVSAEFGMPIGSIGPTRARCLDHLRRILEGSESLGGQRSGISGGAAR